MLLLTWMMLAMVIPSDAELLKQLRKNYEASSKSEKICDQMLRKIPSECSPTELGYKGALRMMKASYAWMPMDKLYHFNQGKEWLEMAIRKDPDNLELRYIRYSVQQSVPAMLGYDHKKTDREFLVKQLPLEKDSELKTMIQAYLRAH